MRPKVLKTDRDHKAALAHVEQLMARTGPDEAELKLWSLLAEKFEEEHSLPRPRPETAQAADIRVIPLKTADFKNQLCGVRGAGGHSPGDQPR